MVRRPHRADRDERLAGIEQPAGRVDPRRLERLGQRQRRGDRRQALGEHRLARARGPDQQHVVHAGRRNGQGPFDVLLPLDVGQISS